MKFNLVVCGGTFDHFHKGHREFLRYGLSLSHKLLIGLTTDKYVKEKNKGEWVDNYQTRKQQLEQFLKEEKLIDRVLIAPIDDIFIPKIWENLPIEGIVVSKNTIRAAEKINLKRKEQRRYSLKVEIAPLVKDQSNEYISSSRIRKGEINREGKQYLSPYWLHHDLVITEELRKAFKKPFGILIKDKENYGNLTSPFLITVGDITSKMFNKLGLNQNISVVDFYVSRHKEFSNLKDLGFSDDEEVISINNPRGHLTSDLFRAVSELFKRKKNKRIVVKIEGEEDLSVLPITLVAPLNSLIFYGQPKKGVVKVFVTEETKERAYNFVNKFMVNTRGH